MPKPHYIESPVRLIEGSDIQAACGTVVRKAVWGFMLDLDSGAVGNATIGNPLRDCVKCLQAISGREGGPRYVYQLIPGEEVKHGEL